MRATPVSNYEIVSNYDDDEREPEPIVKLPELCSMYKGLAKIELHAHLNGSISGETLKKLGTSGEAIAEYEKLTKSENMSKNLDECFALFKHVYNAIQTPEAVYSSTKDVIEEFAKDYVIYLELRTTPRATSAMSKEEYVESVIKAICDHEHKSDILVKLILSLDRRHCREESEEALDLIIRMKVKYPDIVKGVDLCGNPEEGEFNESLFEKARMNGLKVTIHCGEVDNVREIERILKFGPDRIGHGTFLHPKKGNSKENWELYLEKKIPVECCLTSNIICGTSTSYKEHHVNDWKDLKLPFSICTDDKGVFGTTLSKEHALLQFHCLLNPEDLWKMNLDSISYSFASKKEKEDLVERLAYWLTEV